MADPSEPDTFPADLVGQVGQVISRERAIRGFTIAELAGRAGMSAGLLSQLERGIGNPSIDTAAKIAGALNVPIGTFFVGARQADGVVHPGTRKRLMLGDQDLVYELLVPDLRGALSMLHIELPAGFTNESAPFTHAGEEAMILLQGKVTVHVGPDRMDLEPQDSLRFASSIPHWYQVGDDPAIVISAMTPPSF
ncbi:MAG: Transcriptional regulator, family [Nocardioides sp.]|nr:Transcriptional regulator, family [Nocardioides sp.]